MFELVGARLLYLMTRYMLKWQFLEKTDFGKSLFIYPYITPSRLHSHPVPSYVWIWSKRNGCSLFLTSNNNCSDLWELSNVITQSNFFSNFFSFPLEVIRMTVFSITILSTTNRKIVSFIAKLVRSNDTYEKYYHHLNSIPIGYSFLVVILGSMWPGPVICGRDLEKYFPSEIRSTLVRMNAVR